MQSKLLNISAIFLLLFFSCSSLKLPKVYENKTSSSYFILNNDGSFSLRLSSPHLDLKEISVGSTHKYKEYLIINSPCVKLENVSLIPNSSKETSSDSIFVKIFNYKKEPLSSFVIEFRDSLQKLLVGNLILNPTDKTFIPDSLVDKVKYFIIWKINLQGISFYSKMTSISLNKREHQYLLDIPTVFMEANDWIQMNDTIMIKQNIQIRGVTLKKVIYPPKVKYYQKEGKLLAKEIDL